MIFIGLAIGMVAGTILTLILMEVYVKRKLGDLTDHQVFKGNNGFSIELLPCPHCGANDEYILEKNINDKKHVSIMCNHCGAGTGYYENLVDAIINWNSRISGTDKFN